MEQKDILINAESPLLVGPTTNDVDEQQLQPPMNTSEEEEEENVASRDFIDISFQVWGTLAVSILLGLVSGTLYGFGRYSRELKETLSLTQLQVERFGILLDAGNYIGHPVTGLFYDNFGARASCFVAALIVCLAYLAIYWSIHNDFKVLSTDQQLFFEVILQISFFMTGFGSGLGYIAGLGSTTKNFQGTRFLSLAVGVVAAGFGLSSTIVGITYRQYGLKDFFLLWAILVAAVNILGGFVLGQKVNATNEENLMLEPESGLSVNADDENDKNNNPVSSRVEVDDALDVVTKVAPQDHNEADAGSATIISTVSTWQSWRTIEYWLLFCAFACSTGSGLFVINNISTMVQSARGTDKLAGALVITLSLCNCSGRILVGVLASRGFDKLNLFLTVMVVFAASLFVNLFGDGADQTQQFLLGVTVVCVALCYGAIWVLVINILSAWFGNKDFGKNYGLICMGPAISGWAFNSASAWFYQQNAQEDDGEAEVCYGRACYRSSFILTGTACLVGALLLIVLAHHQKRQS